METKLNTITRIITYNFSGTTDLGNLSTDQILIHAKVLSSIHDPSVRKTCELIGDSYLNQALMVILLKEFSLYDFRAHYDKIKSNRFYELFLEVCLGVKFPNCSDWLEISVGALVLFDNSANDMAQHIFEFYKATHFDVPNAKWNKPLIKICSIKTHLMTLNEYIQQNLLSPLTINFDQSQSGEWSCSMSIQLADYSIIGEVGIGQNQQQAKQHAASLICCRLEKNGETLDIRVSE